MYPQYNNKREEKEKVFLVMLEIRPLKTTGVTVEDTGMENCLSKAKFGKSVQAHGLSRHKQ
jgi:hypothetical protein